MVLLPPAASAEGGRGGKALHSSNDGGSGKSPQQPQLPECQVGARWRSADAHLPGDLLPLSGADERGKTQMYYFLGSLYPLRGAN